MSVPTLHSEAAAAIAEIEPSVVRAHTVPIPDDDDDSTGTDVTDEDAVWISVLTLEYTKLTFELTPRGYMLIAWSRAQNAASTTPSAVPDDECGIDCVDRTFETLTSALDNTSPGYRSKFGNDLFAKLAALADTA